MITEIVSTVVAAPLKMIVVSLQVTGEARPIALRLTGSSGEPLTPGTAHGEAGGAPLAGGRTGEQTNLLDWLSSPQTAHHSSTRVEAGIRDGDLLRHEI